MHAADEPQPRPMTVAHGIQPKPVVQEDAEQHRRDHLQADLGQREVIAHLAGVRRRWSHKPSSPVAADRAAGATCTVCSMVFGRGYSQNRSGESQRGIVFFFTKSGRGGRTEQA